MTSLHRREDCAECDCTHSSHEGTSRGECGFNEPHEPHEYVVAQNGKPVDLPCPGLTREPGLREAARDLYSIAVGEHGHDETHSADWPSCLPAHIAMNRYRTALASEDRP